MRFGSGSEPLDLESRPVDIGLTSGMGIPLLASISNFCFLVGGSSGDLGLADSGTLGFEAEAGFVPDSPSAFLFFCQLGPEPFAGPGHETPWWGSQTFVALVRSLVHLDWAAVDEPQRFAFQFLQISTPLLFREYGPSESRSEWSSPVASPGRPCARLLWLLRGRCRCAQLSAPKLVVLRGRHEDCRAR